MSLSESRVNPNRKTRTSHALLGAFHFPMLPLQALVPPHKAKVMSQTGKAPWTFPSANVKLDYEPWLGKKTVPKKLLESVFEQIAIAIVLFLTICSFNSFIIQNEKNDL